MKSRDTKGSMFNKGQNVSLKEAKKMFGLWDNLYNTNAVKNLDPTTRWDPSKVAEEKKKKVETKQDSDDEDEEDEDGKPKLDADGNPIKKKKKDKEPEPAGKNEILISSVANFGFYHSCCRG